MLIPFSAELNLLGWQSNCKGEKGSLKLLKNKQIFISNNKSILRDICLTLYFVVIHMAVAFRSISYGLGFPFTGCSTLTKPIVFDKRSLHPNLIT